VLHTLLNLLFTAMLSIDLPSSLLTPETLTKHFNTKKTFHAQPHMYAKRLQNVQIELASLSRQAPNLNKNVLKYALTAYRNAEEKTTVKKSVLTVIDYSLPSSKQRLWVFDVDHNKLLFNTYVAHGQNSGNITPSHFSNQPESKATSLGTFITKDTYYGHKGYSLNLQGLERGFNDNALSRRVVIHGAWYVEPNFIKQTGRAGRSWGCPSIAQTLARPIINAIKGGSVVFAYYPDRNYLSHTRFATA